MTFQQWWEEHGQYVRAGGGDYEICFAFAAWNAAISEAANRCDGWAQQLTAYDSAKCATAETCAELVRELKATTDPL